ncbi:hypothetical protein M885DRAFT_507108 [Pelagophyceae sp. CCMP2097]|nr:hypothetical protein M885DRAFT_507108 [Pelagophyceae sp. CCMP2097]
MSASASASGGGLSDLSTLAGELVPGGSVLRTVQVAYLMQRKQRLHDVRSDATIHEVLHRLQREGLVSLPVYLNDEQVEGWGGNRFYVGGKTYVGIVSVLDIASFVLGGRRMSTTELAARLRNDLDEPILHVVGSTEESLSLWIAPRAIDVLSAMHQFAGGVHRALVVPDWEGGAANDATGADAKMLTQTDIVDYVVHRAASASLSALFEKTPRDLGLAEPRELLTVTKSSDLVDALSEMVRFAVHAVPVVDAETGAVVDTLSVTDLRGSTVEHLPAMHSSTVGAFLEQRQHRAGGTLRPQVAFEPHQKLGDVAKGMLRWRVHRAWLVDDEGRPTGVVSFTDVIRTVYDNEPHACGASSHEEDNAAPPA